MSKFTTTDADRLLGLGDQFLEDWEDSDREGGTVEGDDNAKERRVEWETYRPLFLAAPELLKCLEGAVWTLQRAGFFSVLTEYKKAIRAAGGKVP